MRERTVRVPMIGPCDIREVPCAMKFHTLRKSVVVHRAVEHESGSGVVLDSTYSGRVVVKCGFALDQIKQASPS